MRPSHHSTTPPSILRAKSAFLSAVLVAAASTLLSVPASNASAQAFFDEDPEEIWAMELIAQKDIDGDGHIGPPPDPTPPPPPPGGGGGAPGAI